jgi:hypothetical protein
LLITSVGSISNVQTFFNRQFIDLQPLRDLYLLINYQISKAYPVFPYYISNLCLWVFIGLLTFEILLIHHSKKYAALLTLLFLSLPCHVLTVLWVSASKHLLAGLFILLFTYYLHNRKTWQSILSFIASVFSHPIYVGAALLPLGGREKNKNKFLILLIATLCVGGNLIFYYVIRRKYNADFNPDTGLELLSLLQIPMAFGRYLIMYFIPWSQAVFYNAFTVENTIGFIVFVTTIFMAVIYRSKKVKRILFYYIVSLAAVTFYPLITFVSNSYFIIGSFLLTCLLGQILKEVKCHNYIFLVMILYNSYFARSEVSYRINSYTAMKESYEKQGNSNSALAFFLLKNTTKENISSYNQKEDLADDIFLLQSIAKGMNNKNFNYSRNQRYGAWYLFGNKLLKIKLSFRIKLKIFKMIQNEYIIYSNYYMALFALESGELNEFEKYFKLFTDQLKLVKIPQYPENLKEKYRLTFYNLFYWLINSVARSHDSGVREKFLMLTHLEEKILRDITPNLYQSWQCYPPSMVKDISGEFVLSGYTMGAIK